LELLGERRDGDGTVFSGVLHFTVHGENLRKLVSFQVAIALGAIDFFQQRTQMLRELADMQGHRGLYIDDLHFDSHVEKHFAFNALSF